jgi:hypothetical protein
LIKHCTGLTEEEILEVKTEEILPSVSTFLLVKIVHTIEHHAVC